MADLQAALEDYLSGLPSDEWRVLVCRVREPDEPLPSLGVTDAND